jgi:hypothetical protein
MKCLVLYRTYAGENRAPRPAWYSRELCLRSILYALDQIKDVADATLQVLHDGPIDVSSEWGAKLRRLVEPRGAIVDGPARGNALAFLEAARVGASTATDDIVVLAEDDYLWLPESLRDMISAISHLDADYVTGYDHPVRYQPDYPLGADLPHWHTEVHITDLRHWRSQESTCMTFCARGRTLLEDYPAFKIFHDNGKGSPADRELFRYLQELHDASHPPRRTEGTRRLLLGPIPSLNTHAHVPWLAPCVDWDAAARHIDAIAPR